ncbi:MAG: EpsI family protein [Nitrospirae bacterium]|nr:EpsI family protein [Nitrospirota bacterium]
MTKKRYIVVIILISLTLIASYSIPRKRYAGTNIIAELKIPRSINNWSGVDVTDRLEIGVTEEIYNFIGDAIAYEYTNKEGRKLLLIILDAGNFHHPNVCFTSAGFEIRELEDTEFASPSNAFKAHTLLTKKGNDNYLSFYWISIDNKIVHEWIDQKIKQLYFSMFNKGRVGLMIRIDIPANEADIDQSILLAKQFISEIGPLLETRQRSFIFGIDSGGQL